MRNFITVLCLVALTPALAGEWTDRAEQTIRENRARDAEARRLHEMREQSISNQIESADQSRKIIRRLDQIEQQNDLIQNDIDDIRSRR